LLPMVTTSFTIQVSTFIPFGITNISVDVKPQCIGIIHMRKAGKLSGGVSKIIGLNLFRTFCVIKSLICR
jgi:hypothetical protein